MSTFSLSQTGTEINSAIGKVHNADSTPTQGSTNMVTSGGVYTAVNNVDVSALPITTEAQGIINQDNDDKVPTNAAVKDLVYRTAEKTVSLSRSGYTEGFYHGISSSGQLRMVDPSSSVSDGVTFSTTNYRTNVTIAQGTYYRLSITSRVNVRGADGSPAQTHQIRDGNTVLEQVTDSTDSYDFDSNEHSVDVYYRPSSVFYASSEKNYSFNTYWIVGDSAHAWLDYMSVSITVYYQRPIVIV